MERLLGDEVYSEDDLLKLLDINQATLDELRREKGFPFVRLTRLKRVYLADSVLDWLKRVATNQCRIS